MSVSVCVCVGGGGGGWRVAALGGQAGRKRRVEHIFFFSAVLQRIIYLDKRERGMDLGNELEDYAGSGSFWIFVIIIMTLLFLRVLLFRMTALACGCSLSHRRNANPLLFEMNENIIILNGNTTFFLFFVFFLLEL